MIPYGRQHIDDDDIAAVVEVLQGDWLTQGPHVAAFEERLCEVTDAPHAVAFSSGTAALHAAAHVAGLGAGDVVCTSPLSFSASANCARYVGADVVFGDIDPDTWNLDLANVPAGVDAAVVVHYAGLPLDLSPWDGSPARPRVVIEDAAHAIGARTPDGPVGNCAHSDLCCFSFHPVKTVTTGEGGAVTTRSAALADDLRRFRHHGIRPTPARGPWAYDIDELGYNYRLTDLQAALGTSQLAKLHRFVARRNHLADRYRKGLAHLTGGSAATLRLAPAAPDGFVHGHHLFPIVVADRERVMAALTDAGIATQVHYTPIYRLTAYADVAPPSAFPNTEAVFAGLLSIPLFPDLDEADQDRIIDRLGEVA
jgi:dTDP-4-amino-4,6-dideoxygalactose transaminase